MQNDDNFDDMEIVYYVHTDFNLDYIFENQAKKSYWHSYLTIFSAKIQMFQEILRQYFILRFKWDYFGNFETLWCQPP